MEFTDYGKVIDHLAESRKSQNLSLTEVGGRMGTIHTTVWRLETKRRIPSFATLKSYASALGHELVIDVREPLIPLD